MFKKFEQEPDEKGKHRVSWHWHNKSLCAEMTQDEGGQMAFIFTLVDGMEEQERLIKRQLKVRKWIKQNIENWDKMTLREQYLSEPGCVKFRYIQKYSEQNLNLSK